MNVPDDAVARRVAHFVERLPVLDAPSRDISATGPRHGSRRGHPVVAGVLAAAAAVVVAVGAGLHIEATSVTSSASSAHVVAMPGRQLLFGADVGGRPIGPVLVAARITTTLEDLPVDDQTVLRDVTGQGVATAPSGEAGLVSPDGRHLAVGSPDDSTLTLIDTMSGASSAIAVPSDSQQARPLGWSRDSATVFIAGTRPSRASGGGLELGAVSEVDVATSTVHRMPALDGATSVSTAPDDRFLAAAVGQELRITDPRTGAVVRRWPVPQGVTFDHDAWSDDGRWLVGVSADRERLVRFAAQTGERVDLPPVGGRLVGATWSGDKYLTLLNPEPAAGDVTPGRSSLIAVDIVDGSTTQVASWDPGLARDRVYDISVARNYSSQFIPRPPSPPGRR